MLVACMCDHKYFYVYVHGYPFLCIIVASEFAQQISV